jgi:hypothetical protein
MKVFISDGSRRTAHNLDDLAERWEIRKEPRRSGFEVEIPAKLPVFETMEAAQKYRADVVFFRERLYYERNLATGATRRDLNKAIAEVSRLQNMLKVRIMEIHASAQKKPTEAENAAKNILLGLLLQGFLLVHENENEIILVFPTEKQTVIIKKSAA